ncbi:conserved hypothetical protein [Planktothrix serta PCC 8927]|uniref:Uncharacterized protein n=1 Tax=Planktothrix serta PCC 8927 TaxID=671068 RepID=A0A7Z9DYK9_9CYAN|nr:hypothetical protein [Planktothrix serta]VXD15981.1 conserved hypothetical protein [Planktothrix serta PCC 8927]
MGSVINPNAQSEAIKQNWKTYHILNIILLSTSLPCWFFTPFLTRDTANNWHRVFRFASIIYAISASSTSLYLSNQLGKLKPKIDALNKREQAEFKHSLASDLYLAQSTNTAIAQFLVAERSSSLSSPNSELLNDSVHEDYSDNEPLVQNRSERGELNRSSVQKPELSKLAQEYFEPVLEALEDGLSDSQIIKDVMGFKNYRYKEGKAILSEIKDELELSED